MTKIGVVGAGAVGSACMFALVTRGSADEIVLVNRSYDRAKGVVTDLQYGATVCRPVQLRPGDYRDLAESSVVVITAGINEKAGGATNRSDPAGRLKLLESNATVYRDIVPKIVAAAPGAIILVVTDPPDPLADLARRLASHDRVLSSGAYLDSLRFRFHLARRLDVSPTSIEAYVLGEHGTSEVFLWSQARIAGASILERLALDGPETENFRRSVESEVRYANITIIEGIGASQFGIGIATARIVEAILRDEKVVFPVGSYHPDYGAHFSLPSVLGRGGVSRVLKPNMTEEEKRALQHSADTLRQAAARVAV